jgi:hypothetical protein
VKPKLFRDDVYNHPDGAYFNSHAYLARIPQIDQLRDGGSVEVLTVDRALLHEVSHWYQYMATSFGLAIGLHRWQQYATALDVLTDENGDPNEKAIARRIGGEPLIVLDGHDNLSSIAVAGSRAGLGQVWHSQVVTDKLLLDAGALSNHIRLPFDFEIMIGDFFMDVLGSPVLFGEPRQLPQDLRSCVKDVPIGVDEYLTTRSIMECAAAVNEYISFLGSSKASSEARDRAWRQLVGPGIYGAPVRQFCQIIGCTTEDLEIWLGSLLLCCDVAMNPIIPPLIGWDVITNRPLKWSELSPAWRFLRCAMACRRLPAWSVDELFEDAQEKSLDIAAAAALEHWSASSLQFVAPHGFLEELESANRPADRTLSGERIFLSYFTTTATELWRLRERGDLRVFANGLLARDGKVDHRWFALPPLLTDAQQNRFWHPKPLATPNTLPLVTVLMAIYSIPDILTGRGALDLSAFPSGLKGRARGALDSLGLGTDLSGMDISFRRTD